MHFKPAPIPDFEEARLADLYALQILDTGNERRFDRYTELIAEVFDFPLAWISVIDRDRQWFKSAYGWSWTETERERSFCGHTLFQPGVFIIPDTHADPRFRNNPFVTGPPYIRFYAGVVVHGPGGQPVGTLCIIDHQPRELSRRETDRLKVFAELVEHELKFNFEIARARQAAEYTAFYDPLTELPNRALLIRQADDLMGFADTKTHRIVFVYIDIVDFRSLNAGCGRDNADRVLCEIADRLRGAVTPSAIVSRIHADHFVVALPERDRSTMSVAEAAAPLVARLRAPFRLDEREVHVGIRIGGSVFPTDGDDAATLIEKAAATARRSGSQADGFALFSEEQAAHHVRRFDLESRLRGALAKGQFRLVYQPQVRLADRRVCGFEALLRWDEPELGPVAPGEFVPVAERGRLMPEIGAWVMREVARQVNAWAAAGADPVPVAVNLTGEQLRDPALPARVAACLEEYEVAPQLLMLELTELSLISDMELACAQIEDIRALGVAACIDDFGTAYSSLNYLRRLPIQSLKLDTGFTRELPGDPTAVTITESVIGLAHQLGLFVIAEGVEDTSQLDFLQRNGCDVVQGFLFHHALSPDEAFGLIAEGRECETGQGESET